MLSSYKGVPVGTLVLYSLIKTNVFFFDPYKRNTYVTDIWIMMPGIHW